MDWELEEKKAGLGHERAVNSAIVVLLVLLNNDKFHVKEEERVARNCGAPGTNQGIWSLYY